jgi:hypothetical protein
MNEDERSHSTSTRGWKTNSVLKSLADGPQSKPAIKAATGIDARTINAILYALQNQGRVAPVAPSGNTNDERAYALVSETVPAVPIVRQVPFKRRGAFRWIPPRSGSDTDAEEVPNWLVPRLPPGVFSKRLGVVHICEAD